MEQFLKENPSTNIRILNNFAKTYCGVGCRFCGTTELPPRRKTFCSQACVDNYCIRTSTSYLRKLLFSRDKGICKICSLDTKLISRQIYDSEKRTGERSELRDTYKIGDKRVKRNGMSCWDADHLTMVALGGGLSGLDNFRTLCKSCHKVVTKSQQELLKQMRKEKKMKISNNPSNNNIISKMSTVSKKSTKKTAVAAPIPVTTEVPTTEVSTSEVPTTEVSSSEKKTRKSKKSETDGKKSKKAKDPNAPKRPQTAFFLYLADVRADFKAANPTVSLGESTKILSEQWATLDAVSKAKYEAKAKELKNEYNSTVQKIKDDAPPKKPQTAFFLYLGETRDSYRREHPELSFGDLTKALSEQWKSIDKSEKDKYEAMSKEAKKEYTIKYAEWKKSHPDTTAEATETEA